MYIIRTQKKYANEAESLESTTYLMLHNTDHSVMNDNICESGEAGVFSNQRMFTVDYITMQCILSYECYHTFYLQSNVN